MKGKMKGKMKGVLLIAVFILSTLTLSIPFASATIEEEFSVMWATTGTTLPSTMPTWSTNGYKTGSNSVALSPLKSGDRVSAVVPYGGPISTLFSYNRTVGATQWWDVVINVYYPPSAEGTAPYMIILLDTTGSDTVDSCLIGGFDMDVDGTLEYQSWNQALKYGRDPVHGDTAGVWQIRDVDSNGILISGTYNGLYDEGSVGNVKFIEMLEETDWSIPGDDPIAMYIGIGVFNNDGIVYLDDVIINGTTYPVEPPTYSAVALSSSGSNAAWATDSDYGRVVILDTDSAATTSDYAIARMTPTTTLDITLATISTNLPKFFYDLITVDTLNYLALEMYFATATGGTAEITMFPYTSSTCEWNNTVGWHYASGHSASTYVVAYGASDNGTAISLATGSQTLTACLASLEGMLSEALSTYILTRVGVQIGWVGVTTDMVAHVDYISINETTYNLEPYPVLNKAWYFTGDTATISYANNLENVDASTVDLVPMTLDSDSDSAKTITLTETGADTGVFTGSITTTASTPAAGQVFVRPDDDFWVADTAISTVRDTGTIDDTVPTVTTLIPARNAITTDNQTTISAAVADTNFLSAYMTVDGEFRGSPRSTAGTMTYTPETLNLLSEGSHTVVVVATDSAGNVNSTTWDFTVDWARPSVTITMNATSPVKAGLIMFTLEFSEGMKQVPAPDIVENVTDAANLALTDAGWTALTNNTYGQNATIGGDAFNGTALITVSLAQDLATNVVYPANFTLYIDNLAPSLPTSLDATVSGYDVVLGWTASTDNGSGMDRYAILRGGTEVGTVDTPTVIWTDTTLTTTATYSYVIRAYDLAGNYADSTADTVAYTAEPSTAYNVTLAEDWNIFSAPLIPTNTSIEAVLADVMVNVTVVWSYQGGVWLRYLPDVPSLSTLTTIEDGVGYWIQMTNTSTFEVTGVELPGPGVLPPIYAVTTGWNLIGFKSVSSMDPTTYITTIPTLVRASAVGYGWDSTLQAYEMVYLAGSAVDSAVFVPGQGYWLYLSEDASIAPPVP